MPPTAIVGRFGGLDRWPRPVDSVSMQLHPAGAIPFGPHRLGPSAASAQPHRRVGRRLPSRPGVSGAGHLSSQLSNMGLPQARSDPNPRIRVVVSACAMGKVPALQGESR